MSNKGYSISKTSFLKFEQCEKAFFLYKNHPYLRDKISIDKMLTFKRGHEVGILAQHLFAGGIDVSLETKNALAAVELTKILLEKGQEVIYEASFLHEGVLVMVDILCKTNNQYFAYEVKSSLRVSENYLKDAYLQYFVLKNTLPFFEDLFLVTLNPDYVRGKEIDVKQLFRKRSVKTKAAENGEYFEYQIRAAHAVLEQNTIPNIAIGKQCFKPYQCDYFGTCWKEYNNEESVFNLPFIGRDKLFEWQNAGIKNIAQLSDDMIENKSHIKIKNAFLRNEAIVERDLIYAFIEKIKGPILVLDMEVWSVAIPEIEGTKCFEQIPFLVSCYDGKDYTHYFAHFDNDDREEFAKQLIQLSMDYTTVVVYDKNLEVGVINTLISRFPKYTAELETLKSKMVDLFDVFLKLWYYHPSFKSTFSLKAVSAALLPDIKYPKIASGLEAINYFQKFRQTADIAEKTMLMEELIAYCDTDCKATFELLAFLKSL